MTTSASVAVVKATQVMAVTVGIRSRASRADESDAKVGLLATMVAEPRDWSMAVIDDPEADDSRLMKEKQRLAGLMLVSIQRDRIVLSKTGSKFECVNLGTKAKGGRKNERRGRKETDQSVKPVGKSFKGAVKKVGKNQYEIDRGMLNEQLEDLSALSRGARVIPHYRDGKPQGFKVVRRPPGQHVQPYRRALRRRDQGRR